MVEEYFVEGVGNVELMPIGDALVIILVYLIIFLFVGWLLWKLAIKIFAFIFVEFFREIEKMRKK